jgi:hypothetical protein
MSATTARAVFDRVNSQRGMVQELTSQLHTIALPRLGHDSTPEQREAWIRHVITTHALADLKVRPSQSRTWAHAFEQVHGEPLL